MAAGLGDFTSETFRPRVGEVFVFERPADQQEMSGGKVRLKLVDVTVHKKIGGMSREPFSLLFTLETGPPLGRGLHKLLHQDFEQDEWFLGRVQVLGRDPKMAYYEAVFS